MFLNKSNKLTRVEIVVATATFHHRSLTPIIENRYEY
jgi:hypothetical protein